MSQTNEIPKTMRAANLHAPADIRVERVPVPEPGAGEVLLAVKACGVCGSDISRVMETGTYRFPTIPGHEFTGEVVALGPGVDGVEVGLRAAVVPLVPCKRCDYCSIGEYHLCEDYDYVGSRRDGAYAEYVAVPADNLLPLPESVDWELGAMTDPAAVALHAVRKLDLQAGDRVAVFGAGPIGVFALQWARILGASQTFAIDVFPEKLRVAAGLGADRVINGRDVDAVDAILEATDGRGVERTVEFAGLPVTQEQCILATAKRGASVWGGISHRGLTLGEEAVDAILRREMRIMGSWNSASAPPVSDWRAAVLFMGRGQLRAGDLISHRLELEAIRETFEMMVERRKYFNKIMFFPEL